GLFQINTEPLFLLSPAARISAQCMHAGPTLERSRCYFLNSSQVLPHRWSQSRCGRSVLRHSPTAQPISSPTNGLARTPREKCCSPSQLPVPITDSFRCSARRRLSGRKQLIESRLAPSPPRRSTQRWDT